MTEAEAHALADKRNAHKGKALWNKTWVAVECDGAWMVALVDSDAFRMHQASLKGAEAMRREQARRVMSAAEGIS